MGEMRLGPVARGLLSYFPALDRLLPSKTGGHTDSAKYCYGVWMKHLTLLNANGFSGVPHTIAELGPGESLGVGLCALLSGADHYVGLDVIAHSNPESNRLVLRDLVSLFQERAPNPDKGWPEFTSFLDERSFPSHVLTEERLRQALSPERIEAIRRAVTAPSSEQAITANYKAPWFDPRVIEENTVDLVISQSVLEHVVDLPATYKALYQWVRPGGWMSHQIDFKSPWAYHALEWLPHLFGSPVGNHPRAPAVHDQSPARVGSPSPHAGSRLPGGDPPEVHAKGWRSPRGACPAMERYLGRRSQLFGHVRHRDQVTGPLRRRIRCPQGREI